MLPSAARKIVEARAVSGSGKAIFDDALLSFHSLQTASKEYILFGSSFLYILPGIGRILFGQSRWAYPPSRARIACMASSTSQSET